MRTKENNWKSKYYTNQSIKSKIDALAEEHQSLQSTLGTDSSQKEIKDVVRKQLYLEAKIKVLDEEYWKTTYEVLRD